MAWQAGMQAEVGVDQVLVEEAQRSFMSRVYRWMFAGLAITGGLAMYTVSNPELLRFVGRSYLFLVVGEFALVLALSFLARRVGGAMAAAMFIAYAALNGLTLSGIFLVYRLGTIGEAFLVTAGTYGAMSAYGALTKKDLSGWGSFLFMGLFGLVLAGVVNIFVRSDMLSFVWSCGAVVVFAGLTAYDNQKLRRLHALNGYTASGSFAVVGALTLYLDFINLFLALLRLFGRRR
jgi:FtsH-binding integral membrane protein